MLAFPAPRLFDKENPALKTSNESATDEAPAAQADPAPAHQTPSAWPWPRWTLACSGLVHGALFVWAAAVLPFQDWSAFAVAAGLLGVSHLVTAVCAALKLNVLPMVWRVQSLLAIAFMVYVGWGLGSSAFYLHGVYAGLGDGLVGAICAVYGIVVLVTLPTALWGVARTGGVRAPALSAAGVLVAVGMAAVVLTGMRSDARGQSLHTEAELDEAQAALEEALRTTKMKPGSGRVASLMQPNPAECASEISSDVFTAMVAYSAPLGTRSIPRIRCVQAPTPKALGDKVRDLLKNEARVGFVKVDLLSMRGEVPHEQPIVRLFALRSGSDGVCIEKKCLMPWQLVAMDVFNTHTPFKGIPDARMGASFDLLAQKLHRPIEEVPKIFRVASRSILRQPGRSNVKVVTLSRSPSPYIEPTPRAVKASADAARRYIMRSQEADGRFAYIVDPHTGVAHNGSFSVARQAGTTLALCELMKPTPKRDAVILKSLDLLASLAQDVPGPTPEQTGAQILRWPRGRRAVRESIGGSALTLIALLRCHSVTQGKYDKLIGSIARLLLHQQRDNGGFAHAINTRRGTHHSARNRLYIDGQAVFALVLLEALASNPTLASKDWPSHATIRDSVERAMDFFGNQYWNLFVDQFFYVEENWHCIAAAAALEYHRNDAYERFCINYTEFKSRFLYDEHSDAPDEFLGAWGFGLVVPPHNTGTSGYGEAQAATLKIKKARGEDVTEDTRKMLGVMAFMIRNQWKPKVCYACADRNTMTGGISEHMASPRVRIDYVQHAWASLAHGGSALGFDWAEDLPVEHWYHDYAQKPKADEDPKTP